MPDPVDDLDGRALAKLAPVAPNFQCYLYERLGEGKNSVLKVTGAEFRAAKSGPRKGQFVILIPGTQRSCFL